MDLALAPCSSAQDDGIRFASSNPPVAADCRMSFAMNQLAVEIALLLALAGSPPAGEALVPPREVRDGLSRALPLIQKGNAGHLEKRSCFACHHQAVPLLAFVTAQVRGVPVDAAVVPTNAKAIAAFLDKNRDNYRKGQGQGGQVDTAGSALWSL